MRIRLAAFFLACLPALLSPPPASALARSQECRDAFALEKTAAEPREKIAAHTRCLETGQPSDTDAAVALVLRGRAQIGLGERERAIEDFSQAILRNPGEDTAYANRGRALLGLGQHRAALEDLDLALTIRPNAPANLALRGLARFGLGQRQAAMADFDQSLDLKPDDPAILNIRGLARLELGQPEGAVWDFTESLRLAPGWASRHFNRGRAYAVLGEHQRAREDFEQALEVFPRYAPAWNSLGWLYATSRDKAFLDGKRALACVGKALEFLGNGGDRERAHYLDTQAAALARTGRYGQAVAVQRKAVALLKAEEGVPLRKITEFEERLNLYRARAPYTEPEQRWQ